MADLQRAALALLCLLAVVLAASLFPASGLGPHPGGSVADVDGAGAAGGGTAPTATPTATPTPADDTATATDDGTATATPTDTPTEAPATDPANSGGDGALADLASLLFGTLVVIGVAAAALAALAGDWSVPGPRADPSRPNWMDGAALAPLYDLLPPPLARGLWRLSRGTTGFVLAASSAVPGVLSALSGALADAGDVAAGLVDGLLRPSGRALAALPRAFAGVLSGLAGLGTALAAIPAALVGFGSGLPSASLPSLPSFGGDDAADAADAVDAPDADADGAPAEPSPPSIEEAWDALRDLVGLGRARARTPGEVARAAVDAGLPAAPVVALTDAFREVRYGDRAADAGRLEVAREALASLRAAVTGDDADDGRDRDSGTGRGVSDD